MLKKLIEFLDRVFTPTYGSELEQYILSRNPQDPGDIERLQIEFDKLQSRGKIL